MKIDTDRILSELYEIDPTFREHEEALREILSRLPETKPNVVVDSAFVMRLRQELIREPVSGFSFYDLSTAFTPLYAHRYAFATLALVLVVGGSIFISQTGDTTKLAISTVPAGSFGSLAQLSQASGDARASAESAPSAKSFAPLGLGGGLGGGAASDMPVPNFLTRYVYRGEEFTIPATGYVYKHSTDAAAGQKLVNALGGMRFGVDTGSFSSLTVRNIEAAETRDYGYAINLYIPSGQISINANWDTWHMQERSQAPFERSDVPSNETVLAIADNFFAEHRISLEGYGEPVIDQAWLDMPEAVATSGATMPAYTPEMINLTYPLTIEGLPVYESWGAPVGLQVTVDLRTRRVSSVNNLTTLGYERSEYALETNVQKIKDLATGGGGAEFLKSGGSTAELDTPKPVLMRYYRYANSRNEELLVPAMLFPIKGQSGAVVTPLVKDIVS